MFLTVKVQDWGPSLTEMSPKSWTVLSNSTTSPTWTASASLSSGAMAIVGFSTVWLKSCKAFFTSALLAFLQPHTAARRSAL